MFVLLTFAISWLFYGLAAAIPSQLGQLPRLAVPLIYGGTFGPSIAAMLLASQSRGGAAGMWRAVRRVKQPLWAYAFAVGYVLSLKGVAALVQWAVTDERLHAGFAWYLFPVAVLVSTPVQIGEELGWRGYLLPRAASEIGYGRASLVIGGVWAVWHLPLFFIRGVDLYGQSFTLFALGVIPVSVAITWLYVRTNGSVFLTMLMHSAINQTTVLFSSGVARSSSILAISTSLYGWLTLVLLWLGALVLLSSLRSASIPKAPNLGLE